MPQRESDRAELLAKIMRNLVSHSLEINTQEGREGKASPLLEMRYSDGNPTLHVKGLHKDDKKDEP